MLMCATNVGDVISHSAGLAEIFKNGYDGRVVGTGGFVGQAAK